MAHESGSSQLDSSSSSDADPGGKKSTSDRQHKSKSSKARKQLRPSEVIEQLNDMHGRAGKGWLSDVLVQCQELVLKAMLASLQPMKKASSPQPSAGRPERKRKPTRHESAPEASDTEEDKPPPRKAPKSADGKHAPLLQISGPSPQPALSMQPSHVPYQALPAPNPAPALQPARQSARHAEAVAVFNSQRQASLVQASAVEASAAAVLQALHQGDGVTGAADTRRLPLKSSAPKAQWPADMAAIVAEEMIAADQANRTINFKFLLSRLGDSYTEKQVKTKIDTLRKQQRRHPNALGQAYLSGSAGMGNDRYPSEEEDGEEQEEGDEGMHNHQQHHQEENGDADQGVPDMGYHLLEALDAPRGKAVSGPEASAPLPRVGMGASWLSTFRAQQMAAGIAPPMATGARGRHRTNSGGAEGSSGRVITTVMLKQEGGPASGGTRSGPAMPYHSPRPGVPPPPEPPPPQPPSASHEETADQTESANGEASVSPAATQQPGSGPVLAQRHSQRQSQRKEAKSKEANSRQQQQPSSATPTPPPPQPPPPARAQPPAVTSTSLRQKIQDMLAIAPGQKGTVEHVVEELLTEPGYQRMDPGSLRKEVASILSSGSEATTAQAEEALE